MPGRRNKKNKKEGTEGEGSGAGGSEELDDPADTRSLQDIVAHLVSKLTDADASQEPLFLAVCANDPRAIKTLVRTHGRKVDVWCKPPDVKMTPLHLGCRHGDDSRLACVEALCSNGADVNKLTDDIEHPGSMAAHVAVYENNIGCLRVLVQHGADLDAAGCGGMTLACIAARDGFLEILRFLHSR
jgi:ankyrin repeat protein